MAVFTHAGRRPACYGRACRPAGFFCWLAGVIVPAGSARDAQGEEIVKKRDKVEQGSARERDGSGGTFCPLEQKWNRWAMANLDGGS
jgi:hypothetical protein